MKVIPVPRITDKKGLVIRGKVADKPRVLDWPLPVSSSRDGKATPLEKEPGPSRGYPWK